MKEVTEKTVKQAINYFFEYGKVDYSIVMSIILVQLRWAENDGGAIVTITTKRPGLLIGKQGETLDALTVALLRVLGLSYVKINIVEFDPFNMENSKLFDLKPKKAVGEDGGEKEA